LAHVKQALKTIE